MTVQDLYNNLHGDFQEACKRLLNEKMVANFVLKFPADPSMQQLRDAVAAHDIETSFRAIHTLKSVSGVLSFTQLYKVAWDLTEQLRPRLDEADPALLELVEKEYAVCINAIKEFAENQ
ncbi:MAG: Hpt domain-containing protein [Bacteroidales bacterium]|nr:Hpt domain-containing protein [Bacteroidales bacterium]